MTDKASNNSSRLPGQISLSSPTNNIFPSSVNVHQEYVNQTIIVQGSEKRIEIGRKPFFEKECAVQKEISPDHFRKRRLLSLDWVDNGKTHYEGVQKVSKLPRNSPSTTTTLLQPHNNSVHYGVKDGSRIISTRSKSTHRRRDFPSIGQRKWPIAFVKCKDGYSAEKFSKLSERTHYRKGTQVAATEETKLSEVVDGVMNRARLRTLRQQMETIEDKVLFVKASDGLTNVVFSNGYDKLKVHMGTTHHQATTPGGINTVGQTHLLNQDLSRDERDCVPLAVPITEPTISNENPSGLILSSKVINNPPSANALPSCPASSSSSPSLADMDCDQQQGIEEAVNGVPVESRVIGKNGCMFDRVPSIPSPVSPLGPTEISRDDSCLFHGLPERPVLIPPATTSLSGLAQPPPLARHGSGNGSNSEDASPLSDPAASSENRELDRGGDIVISNRSDLSYPQFSSHSPPLLVSIPYIGAGCPTDGTWCMDSRIFAGLKSMSLGMQPSMSGSFFVNSIPQSLRAQVKPNVPFVDEFQDTNVPSLLKSTNNNATTPESTLATILEFIQKGEDVLCDSFKEEDKKEVFKEVVSGKVINKVTVE